MDTIDWTSLDGDPNNPHARSAAAKNLKSIRQLHTDTDLIGFVLKKIAGKRVLDIGFACHTMKYADHTKWRHALISKSAKYCLGIDILAPMIKELSARGYNLRCVDATSEEDLGERFDYVFIGDVLMHVENPSALFRFAGRHLSPGGRILISTPNPFSRKFIRQFMREGVMVVCLDHVAWITPTHVMELARRTKLSLVAYHLIKPIPRLKRSFKEFLTWRFEPRELTFPDYLYELTVQN